MVGFLHAFEHAMYLHGCEYAAEAMNTLFSARYAKCSTIVSTLVTWLAGCQAGLKPQDMVSMYAT